MTSRYATLARAAVSGRRQPVDRMRIIGSACPVVCSRAHVADTHILAFSGSPMCASVQSAQPTGPMMLQFLRTDSLLDSASPPIRP